MLEGITVLAQEGVYCASSIAICHGLVGLIATVIFALISDFCFKEMGPFSSCFFGVLSLIGAITFIGSFFLPNEYSYEKYQVLIDDSISLNNFYNKYVILNQEGMIYTIREKFDAEE